MNYRIMFEPIRLETIKQYGHEQFNSNNHWIENERPHDYFAAIDACNTKHWINKLNRPYKKIIIDDEDDLALLKRMSRLSKRTGKSSNLFEDELLTLVAKCETIYPDIFEKTCKGCKEYFVRSENVSLKYGEHGLNPCTNFRTMIESVVTCPAGHTPLYSGSKELVLYLFDWLTMNECDEFRVFVKNKKITCISQQHIYSTFELNEISLHTKINALIEYFETVVVTIIDQPDFSYDFTFISGSPYFIEPNSFGKEYAAGSALFHWIRDYDKLVGLTDTNNNNNNTNYTHTHPIYVRYVV
jgi:hypothetical protein